MSKCFFSMEKQKKPVSIILITIWMFIATIGLLIKQFNFERISLNAEFLGGFLSLANYAIDWLVLVVFIVFIFLFIKRKEKVNKYFIFFILFLIIGDVIGFVLGFFNMERLSQVAPYIGEIPQSLLIFVSVISFVINLVIYLLIIYFTKKHRQYFSR